MSVLRRQTISAILALLFVSIALPGCISLVLGREMMEGARGEPKVRDVSASFDLSHAFIADGSNLDEYHEIKSEQIPIDHTVQEIIINFEVTLHYDDVDDIIPDWVPLTEEFLDLMDQRYVEVWLKPCDENGANCEEAIYHERTNKSLSLNRTELGPAEIEGREGTWRLEVEGQGIGFNSGLPIDFQDSWTLRATVVRPCLSFPETDDICTATVEFE